MINIHAKDGHRFGPYKRLLDNFHQSESPNTFNVKLSKITQNSAMSNGNSANNALHNLGGNSEQFARRIGIGCGA